MEDVNINSKALNNKDKHVVKFLASKINLKSTTLYMLQGIFLVGVTGEFHFNRVVWLVSLSSLSLSFLCFRLVNLSFSQVWNHASFNILNFICNLFPHWIPEYQGWPKRRGPQFSPLGPLPSLGCVRPVFLDLSFALVLYVWFHFSPTTFSWIQIFPLHFFHI